MRGAGLRHLSGICLVGLVAVGCSGDDKSSNQLLGVSGQGGEPAAGSAGSGLGVMMTAGTTAGAAGIAPPTAGVGGSPRGGSAGQAGTATAGGPGLQAGTGSAGIAGSAGAAGGPSSGTGAGGGGASGSAGAAGGAAGAAGAAGAPAGDPCALKTYVNGGVKVSGAGCKQQWEGIVMTVGGRGLCTAAFISDRHLISASHCYSSNGAVSLDVSAPTWDNGMKHTFQAQVKRSGSNMSLDISIIDLGKPVEWATPERRFVLHAGKASAIDLYLYGFGSGGSSGAAGTLRAVPNRATIRVTDNGRGNLTGKAGAAQLCTGDSGGPAFAEKTAAVLYGINQAIVPSGTGGGRTCASSDWTIMFTNVSQYMSFIEMSLGKTCERKRVDDLDVAQCW